MMTIHQSYFFVPVAGLLLLGLGSGCAEQSEAQPDEGDLADLEASLAATTSSLASTDVVVQECFTDFRSCVEAASDADERASCREALTVCLPDQPLAPPECAGDAGVPGPGRGFGRGGRGQGFGFGPRFGGPDGDAAGGFCAPFFPLGGGFAGCFGRVRDALAGGGEPGDVASSCRACVREAFEEQRAALCEKAAELCALDGAPERICARVSDACADAADAGTP